MMNPDDRTYVNVQTSELKKQGCHCMEVPQVVVTTNGTVLIGAKSALCIFKKSCSTSGLNDFFIFSYWCRLAIQMLESEKRSPMTILLPPKCGVELQKVQFPQRRKRLGAS